MLLNWLINHFLTISIASIGIWIQSLLLLLQFLVISSILLRKHCHCGCRSCHRWRLTVPNRFHWHIRIHLRTFELLRGQTEDIRTRLLHSLQVLNDLRILRACNALRKTEFFLDLRVLRVKQLDLQMLVVLVNGNQLPTNLTFRHLILIAILLSLVVRLNLNVLLNNRNNHNRCHRFAYNRCRYFSYFYFYYHKHHSIKKLLVRGVIIYVVLQFAWVLQAAKLTEQRRRRQRRRQQQQQD